MKLIKPKQNNSNIGFHFTVTEEQVKAHRRRSVAEIFAWLEELNKFLYTVQTPEERMRMFELKGKKFSKINELHR